MTRKRFNRTAAEAAVRRLLRGPLKRDLALLHWAERCVLAFAKWFEEVEDQRPHQEVLAILYARIAADLRVMRLCAERGYTLQLMTVASATFELSFAAAYIVDHDRKAARWVHWPRGDRLPWKWRAMVEGGLENAVGARHFRGVELEEAIYGMLCRAKHGNPGLQSRTPRATSDVSYVMNVDPLLTPSAPRSVMLAVYLALRGPVVALLALARIEAYQPLVGLDAEEIAKGWLELETRMKGWQRRR